MLEVKNIHFSYENKKTLEDVSLDVAEGEVVGLLGANGTGKSTLFKNILSLVKSRQGSCHIDGIDLHKLSDRERAKYISYVPQFMNIIFPITAFDFVMTGIKTGAFRGDAQKMREETAKTVELFELEDLAFKDMRKMSGGERQRIFIARAFAQKPRVIILDEPTSSLDFKYKNVTLRLLNRLAKESKIGILIALHDLSAASKYCDSFVVMKGGKVLARGDADTVFSKELMEETYGAPADILDYKGQKIVIFT
ncbi:MAG: ABC transporter ATP-binding protein [Peptostreptococcaceae bacterium]|nr:ABC transporter ATP-binding protein [Peptostreptococcaceae bacterium]